MQHTEKRNFNIIEATDPFSPEALNENTRKIEAALETADGRFDEANSRLTQAVEQLGAENLWVKLGTIDGTASDTTAVFDLSMLDRSKYGAYLLLFSAYQLKQDTKLVVNGEEAFGNLLYANTSGGTVVWFFPSGNTTAVSVRPFGRIETSASSYGGILWKYSWDQVQSIGMKAHTSLENAHMRLYALKA